MTLGSPSEVAGETGAGSAAAPGPAAAPIRAPAHGWLVTWRVEMVKLAAQLKVRVALAACLAVPFLVVVVEKFQTTTPGDTVFGQWIHESGFADSLFLLAFLSQWGLPFLVAIVAGDICAEEDRRLTWPLMLTRSHRRGEVLAGKIVAAIGYSVVATVLLALSSTVSGIVVVGTQPVVSLSGALLPAGPALGATAASWASLLPPVLAVAALAVFISVLSRNTWVGVAAPVVVVFVLGFVSQLSIADAIRPFLPTTGFDAWHGLARDSVYTGPLWTSVAVSALWVAVFLGAAAWIFARRDIVE